MEGLEKQKEYELLTLTSNVEVPYYWSIGHYAGKFLIELRDSKRLVGIRCPECGKVYTPPRKVCGPCFTEMNEVVQIGNTGTLLAYSVVDYKFIDPNTGKNRPVPYIYGYIKLDGADNTFSHIIDYLDVEKLKVGARVKAVFGEKRVGLPWDIKYFKVVD